MLAGYAPLIAAFVIVSLAEFGDKSQIGIITLSARRKAIPVFIGSIIAFLLVDGILSLASGSIARYLPVLPISIASGIFFILFGIYTLFSKEKKAKQGKKNTSGSIRTSFLTVAALENGDKTQLAIIALSAQYAAPVQVFAGVMLAFVILTALAIAFGSIMQKHISSRGIKIGSGILFITFGMLFLIGAAAGISIL